MTTPSVFERVVAEAFRQRKTNPAYDGTVEAAACIALHALATHPDVRAALLAIPIMCGTNTPDEEDADAIWDALEISEETIDAILAAIDPEARL